MALLNETEIADALGSLPGWEHDGERITKDYSFASFMDAIGFINRIAAAADAADHHPDLENHYTKVKVSLRSWDAGGVTRRDVRLAAQIEALA